MHNADFCFKNMRRFRGLRICMTRWQKFRAFCTPYDERSFEFLGKYANQLLKVQLWKQLIMGTMMCIIIFPKCQEISHFEI